MQCHPTLMKSMSGDAVQLKEVSHNTAGLQLILCLHHAYLNSEGKLYWFVSHPAVK